MIDDQRTNRHLSQGRVQFKYMETKFSGWEFSDAVRFWFMAGKGAMEIGMTICRDFSPEAHGHHLLGVAYRWVGSALSPLTNGETLNNTVMLVTSMGL